MGKLTKLAGETAIYGLSSIIGRAINFILVPFYTTASILSVVDNGVLIEMYAIAAFLNIVYLFGMETAYFRFVSKNPAGSSDVYNTAFTYIFISSILLSGIFALSATPIANWLEFPGRNELIYWFAAILGIDAIVSIPFARLRYEKKAIKFATIKLINIFLNVALNVFFLYFCKNVYHGNFLVAFQPFVDLIYNPNYGVEYVFISNLIANFMYLPLLARSLARTKIYFDLQLIKPMFYYALPLMVMGLAGVTNEMFSRSLLKKLLPDDFYPGRTAQEALAIFGNCYKLSLFMSLAIQAFRYAAEPFFFAQTLEKDTKQTYANVFYYFVIFGLFAVLAISLNLDILKVIFLRNPVYWEGLHVVPVLLFANFFLGLYYNFSIWYKVTDKTIVGTIISVTAAVATLLLNIWLIPLAGYEGSSYITLAVYLGMAIAAYLLGQKSYPVPYNVKKAGFYLLFTLALLLLGLNLKIEHTIYNQIFKELLIVVFLLVVFFQEINPKIKS